MISNEITLALLACFRRARVNNSFEFVSDSKGTCSFSIGDCNSREDVEAKLLQWFTRATFMPDNKRINHYYIDGLNMFLKRNFEKYHYKFIFDKIGNGINPELAKKFVESGLKLSVLRDFHE